MKQDQSYIIFELHLKREGREFRIALGLKRSWMIVLCISLLKTLLLWLARVHLRKG